MPHLRSISRISYRFLLVAACAAIVLQAHATHAMQRQLPSPDPLQGLRLVIRNAEQRLLANVTSDNELSARDALHSLISYANRLMIDETHSPEEQELLRQVITSIAKNGFAHPLPQIHFAAIECFLNLDIAKLAPEESNTNVISGRISDSGSIHLGLTPQHPANREFIFKTLRELVVNQNNRIAQIILETFGDLPFSCDQNLQ